MDSDDERDPRGGKKQKSPLYEYDIDIVSETVYLTGDKKLSKRIIVSGDQGANWMKDHQQAVVDYIGRLENGEIFDNSKFPDPFIFTIGEGKVIKGWEIGIGGMLPGERAEFTIGPEYAYGEAGCPPKIPPNATLKFTVELA